MTRASRTFRGAVVAAALAVGGVAVASSGAQAAGASPRAASSGCEGGPPVTVLYINGIATDGEGARDSGSALRRFVLSRIGDPRQAGDVEFGALHNPTAGIVLDVVEVLDQKLEELVDAGILTAKQVADFGAELAGAVLKVAGTPTRAVARLVATLPIGFVRDAARKVDGVAEQVPELFVAMQKELSRQVARAVESFTDRIVTSSETRAVQRRMADRVRDAAAGGRRVVLVGHSQGNLFANAVVEELADEALDLQVVHVAPPMRERHGPYVLVDSDLVIAAVAAGLSGIANRPPAPNAHVPPNGLNHGFTDVYLAEPDPASLVEDELADMVGHCLAVGVGRGTAPVTRDQVVEAAPLAADLGPGAVLVSATVDEEPEQVGFEEYLAGDEACVGDDEEVEDEPPVTWTALRPSDGVAVVVRRYVVEEGSGGFSDVVAELEACRSVAYRWWNAPGDPGGVMTEDRTTVEAATIGDESVLIVGDVVNTSTGRTFQSYSVLTRTANVLTSVQIADTTSVVSVDGAVAVAQAIQARLDEVVGR